MRLKMSTSHKERPCLNDVLALNNKNFELSQNSWKQALQEYKELLEVRNKDEFDQQVEEITSETELEEFKQDQSNLLKEAKFRACMQNNKMIKYIAWIPLKSLVTKPLCNPDGSLKGHCICRYVDKNNEEQECELNTQWVESHFDNVILAYAQKAAYNGMQLG